MPDETNRTPEPDLTEPLPTSETDLTQPLPAEANEDATKSLPTAPPAELEPQVSDPTGPQAIPADPSASEPELTELTAASSAPSAFDPRITGEEALSPTATQPRIPAPDGAPAAPWSDASYSPAQPVREETAGIRFGLLTWSIVLVMMGVLLLVAPVAQYIDWGTTIMAVFALLGIFMLVVALIVAIRDRRK